MFKKKKERKEKRKNKHPQTTFSSFFSGFWRFFIICPMVLVLFYFNGIILFAITEKELHVWSFKLWAFLCCGEGVGGIVWFPFSENDRLGFCLCVCIFYPALSYKAHLSRCIPCVFSGHGSWVCVHCVRLYVFFCHHCSLSSRVCIQLI